MTDNSPEYFEQAETIAVRVMQATLPIEKLHDVITVLRAAAALAREVQEMRTYWPNSQWTYDEYNSFLRANRALQDEVDRLIRAVERKNEALIATSCQCKSLPQSTTTYIPQCERCQAIAYTGTEPQEVTK